MTAESKHHDRTIHHNDSGHALPGEDTRGPTFPPLPMAGLNLPERLPATVLELISELDRYILPAVVVDSNPDRNQLIFDAGRRNVVDLLLAIRDRQRKE